MQLDLLSSQMRRAVFHKYSFVKRSEMKKKPTRTAASDAHGKAKKRTAENPGPTLSKKLRGKTDGGEPIKPGV